MPEVKEKPSPKWTNRRKPVPRCWNCKRRYLHVPHCVNRWWQEPLPEVPA